MKTPLGEKKGILVIEKNGSTLTGWLDIMRHREAFEGTVDEAGNCSISGAFVTLMRRVSYVASGQISASALHLRMEGERNVFELAGTSCPESEE